jgi:ATP-binding cassette, subfamily B, bacterial
MAHKRLNGITLLDQAYASMLRKYLGPQWRLALGLTALLFADIILRLVNPQLIRDFIDRAQAGGETSALLRTAMIFLGLALVQQAVSVLASYVGEVVAWTTTNNLRLDLTRHCLGLDLSFHNNHTPGEMIERIDGDTNNLATFFSRFVIEIIGNGLLIVGILVLMWLENWSIGLGLTVFVVLGMGIMIRYRDVAVPHWSAERQASADMYSFLEERLAGTEDIRANGAVAYVQQKFHVLIREVLRKSLKSAMVFNVLMNINEFLFAVGTAAAFAIAAYLFLGELISIGTVFLVYQYTNMLTGPMANISRQMDQFQRAGAGVMRIQALFQIESKLKDPAIESASGQCLSDHFFDSENEQRLPLGIQFEGVYFAYDDVLETEGVKEPEQAQMDSESQLTPVLENISFDLAPGKILGLLGRTGSGKTSLTRLAFRFYDPLQGAVFIRMGEDGQRVDLKHVPLEWLRRQVGMVTQNIQLFNASIRDNLTFFDTSIPDERIEAVIRELGLSAWFQALPSGLDTVLESGGNLSGGEAQLLALTRIFLCDPGLVILDEASSRLDPLTESLIEKAIDRLLQDRTAIIIAHHLETVHKAEQIMILEDGSIQEYGERESLASDPQSRFSQLLKSGMTEVLM